MAKVLINLPDTLLEHVDERAQRNHLTRSEATREAFRLWLAQGDYIAPIDRPGFHAIRRRILKAGTLKQHIGPAEKWIREARESR